MTKRNSNEIRLTGYNFQNAKKSNETFRSPFPSKTLMCNDTSTIWMSVQVSMIDIDIRKKSEVLNFLHFINLNKTNVTAHFTISPMSLIIVAILFFCLRIRQKFVCHVQTVFHLLI